MNPRIVSVLGIVLIVGTCISRSQGAVGTYCLHIFRVEAQLVDVVRTPIGETRSVPPGTFYKQTGCRFRLNIDVISDDSTFLQTDSAFLVIGRLPDGKPFRQVVRTLQMIKSTSDIFCTSFEVQTTKAGWADVILAPLDTRGYGDLYDYPVKSNKRSVHLDCRF